MPDVGAHARSIAVDGATVLLSMVAGLFCLMPRAAAGSQPEALAALVRAYPDFLVEVDGNALVWKDGERMTIDDGKSPKAFAVLLDQADIKDQFYAAYPSGPVTSPPGLNSDPGRVRNQRFFEKMYGDCRKGEVKGKLVEVDWLPKSGRGQKLRITGINGVAAKLALISRELDELGPEYRRFLSPSSGTYNCRPIAGTNRVSGHGFGFAIDLNASQAEYWQWDARGKDRSGVIVYKNRVPWPIVEIFEKHGFIWGGKWYHYDTMHFEYRPEFLAEFLPGAK